MIHSIFPTLHWNVNIIHSEVYKLNFSILNTHLVISILHGGLKFNVIRFLRYDFLVIAMHSSIKFLQIALRTLSDRKRERETGDTNRDAHFMLVVLLMVNRGHLLPLLAEENATVKEEEMTSLSSLTSSTWLKLTSSTWLKLREDFIHNYHQCPYSSL